MTLMRCSRDCSRAQQVSRIDITTIASLLHDQVAEIPVHTTQLRLAYCCAHTINNDFRLQTNVVSGPARTRARKLRTWRKLSWGRNGGEWCQGVERDNPGRNGRPERLTVHWAQGIHLKKLYVSRCLSVSKDDV
jgi:hypothetical protein